MIDQSFWSPVGLAWVAGLLEGEGNFALRGQRLVARLKMTDEDVVKRCHDICGFGTFNGPYREKNQDYKPYWTWGSSCSADVYCFEREIFSIMHIRRQQQILETHRLRREYERSTSRNNIIRIFPPNCGCLLLDKGCICV